MYFYNTSFSILVRFNLVEKAFVLAHGSQGYKSQSNVSMSIQSKQLLRDNISNQIKGRVWDRSNQKQIKSKVVNFFMWQIGFHLSSSMGQINAATWLLIYHKYSCHHSKVFFPRDKPIIKSQTTLYIDIQNYKYFFIQYSRRKIH